MKIQLPDLLAALCGGAHEVDVAGDDVAGALADLSRKHPVLHNQLFNDGNALRPHVNIFVGEEDIRSAQLLATRVRAVDTIIIVPSISGG